MNKLTFSKEEYLSYNPFDGDMDVDIKCSETKIVKVKQRHQCSAYDLFGLPLQHYIEPGDFAFYEHALVDGLWGSSWCCIDCMDIFLKRDVGLKVEDKS